MVASPIQGLVQGPSIMASDFEVTFELFLVGRNLDITLELEIKIYILTNLVKQARPIFLDDLV